VEKWLDTPQVMVYAVLQRTR